MCPKPQIILSSQDQHLRMRKIRITKGTSGRNVYVCYKQERFSEIFARILCHNLCLRGISVSLGVRYSQNEAQFAPNLSRAKKNYFEPHNLNIQQLEEIGIIRSSFQKVELDDQ